MTASNFEALYVGLHGYIQTSHRYTYKETSLIVTSVWTNIDPESAWKFCKNSGVAGLFSREGGTCSFSNFS